MFARRWFSLPVFAGYLGALLGVSATSAYAAAAAAQAAAPTAEVDPAADLPPGLYAEVTTPRGIVVAELFYEKTPMTVTSFVGLAEGTLGPADTQGHRKPFFDGLTFHRVIPGFVAQGGDPLGNGEGGPGYEFPDEFVPGLSHDRIGTMSMANAGPDTNGSQWVFTLAPVTRLDWLHTVFGRAVRGLDVLPLIQQGDTMQVKILRIGDAAKAFRADEASLQRLIAGAPKATPPHFDDDENVLPTEPPWARINNNKLTNLQRFTGAQLYVHLHKTRAPEDATAKPGALAHRLAEKAGIGRTGIAAEYYDEHKEWALWIGDDVLERFTPKGTTAKDSLHARKQACIAAARARAADVIAAAEAKGKTLTDAQKLKVEVDELFEELIPVLVPGEKSEG